ncbi:MAG: hypothetical protein MUW56_09265 [Chryseobacterium sp.]|uniref:hypothetical protein n=1 Tax=Chryseobacterium sp. TaxID=1871047 RepID=UPI0025BA58A9|nr:hypothetical protein [Chryseobacterium sp.]MCJ7933807.1 hypothetical protein [Chryseobacterium sp.]
MEKFQRYYLSFLLLIVYTNTIAQVNCGAIEGEDCKKACELYNWASDSDQQDFRESQEGSDKAVELCPDFAGASIEKAVPYLKNGDLISWRIVMDEAVELDSKMYLGYRGWCKFQFLKDDERAVLDLEALKKYDPEHLGRSGNGDHNLGVVKAMSDHYLGVTYFELGRYDKTLEHFEKQGKGYEFAENIYLKSKVSKIRNKDYLDLKTLALQTYDEKTMKEVYIHHMNKVYRKQM